MALYVVDCGRLFLTDDPTMAQAEVTVRARVGANEREFTTNVVVALGSNPNQTNTNILAAAVAQARTQFGLAVNEGGTDRTGMTGGRTL